MSPQKKKKYKILENKLITKFGEFWAEQLKKPQEGLDKIGYTTSGRPYIRCQKVMDSGRQCVMPAFVSTRSLYCKTHGGMGKSKAASTPADVRKLITAGKNLKTRENSNHRRKRNLLVKEMKRVEKMSDEELLDARREIRTAEAIIQSLEEQDWTDEKDRMRKIRSLMYTLRMATDIKKAYFDVKYADQNVITKEFFVRVFNRYNQIITEEVRDARVLQKISDRIRNLGIEMRERGIK